MTHQDDAELRNEHVDMTTRRSPLEHEAPAANGPEHGATGGVAAMGGIGGAAAGYAAGAIAHGAIAGAAAGVVGGPIAMAATAAVGAVVGAVGGAAAGAGIERSMSAEAESRELKDRADAPPADSHSPRPFTAPPTTRVEEPTDRT